MTKKNRKKMATKNRRKGRRHSRVPAQRKDDAMTQEPPGRTFDLDGVWYLVAISDGLPAVTEVDGVTTAYCSFFREVAERGIAMAPGKGLVIKPIHPRNHGWLQEAFKLAGVTRVVAGLFREATPEEIGRGEGVESEVPPRYVIKAADVIRVLREIHETGKAPKLDE
jgi:hypothetical protein